ncbi:MAG: hypothetical protein JJU29_04900 [Verrucomicrobia bacterium]|nr:hypothetical protein [Verrucomicrobiota bacterium]MCH8510253.1 hypothetical protein [Kiritimatiellia bacterium]
MITPMSHVTLLCRGEDADALLDHLRAAGVVHLDITRKSNRNLERLEQSLEQTQKVIQKLEALPAVDGDPSDMDPEEIVEVLLCREQELKDIQAVDAKLAREEKTWEPFGDLQGDTLRALGDQGVHVRFYRAPGGTPEFGKDITWIPAREGFGLGIALNAPPQIEAVPLTMPVRSPGLIRQRRARLADLTRRHQEAIARHTVSLDALKAHRDAQADALDYTRAHLGMSREGEISWITGYVPDDTLDAVKQVADTAGAALLSREPGETDAPPTLLKHRPMVSWIQPVFNFLGVVPGYREVDVGWSFLVFLTVFSAMIIGDAGYGFLLLAGVAITNIRKPHTRGPFSKLLMLMGVATVLWGALSGNYFGVVVPFRIHALSDANTLMNICFTLGAVHLSIAHGWTLWNQRKTLQALAQLGWIGTTWTMYFVTASMVLGHPSPAWMPVMAVVSVLLIIVFMTPFSKFKEEIMQYAMLPMSLVNNFVDVISYVRLYAVGMATLAMASSFNDLTLGGSAGRNFVITGLMIIILLFGHALNCVLAALGIMVHGVRLNTLEFSSHMGLTWSGIPYMPFQKLRKHMDAHEQPWMDVDPDESPDTLPLSNPSP